MRKQCQLRNDGDGFQHDRERPHKRPHKIVRILVPPGNATEESAEEAEDDDVSCASPLFAESRPEGVRHEEDCVHRARDVEYFENRIVGISGVPENIKVAGKEDS